MNYNNDIKLPETADNVTNLPEGTAVDLSLVDAIKHIYYTNIISKAHQYTVISANECMSLSGIVQTRNIDAIAEAVMQSKELFKTVFQKLLQRIVTEVGLLRARKNNVSMCAHATFNADFRGNVCLYDRCVLAK